MTAKERIDHSASLNLYKKVGRKYVQATDNDAYNGLREGYWLVRVGQGTSIRQCVYPDRAELDAAIHKKRERLIDIIRKVSEATPKEGIKMTEQARLDWEHFISKHGAEFNTLYYPSIHDNAQMILDEILKKD